MAQAILTAKNVPYVVAAPLLIQDIKSWTESGIGGLQSTILYALPELDGAIDTVPLGGLVNDDIYLTRERVYALSERLKKWHNLRNKEKKTPKTGGDAIRVPARGRRDWHGGAFERTEIA